MPAPMPPLFDDRQLRRARSRAAAGHDAAAALPREIGARLLESLAYLDERVPGVALDVGSGTGHIADALRKRWPKTRVIALDASRAMLDQGRHRAGWLRPLLGRDVDRLQADPRALPLADASVDVLVAHLSLPWVDQLPGVFAGFRRVLKPDGLLLCSAFGPETLIELHQAFADDTLPHVHPFAPIAHLGDALMAAGFRDPVLDRDAFTFAYPDLSALLRELRALGMTNALAARRRSLTGKGRLAAAQAACETLRRPDGRLPVTWEALYAHAWAPAPGAPIREDGHDVVAVPISAIPIRRRVPKD